MMKVHEKIALVAHACGYEIQEMQADGTCWVNVDNEKKHSGDPCWRLFNPHVDWKQALWVAAALNMTIVPSDGLVSVSLGGGEAVIQAHDNSTVGKLIAIRDAVMAHAVAIGLKKQRGGVSDL